MIVADTPGLRTLADEGLARPVRVDTSAIDLAAIIEEELAKTSPLMRPQLPTWDDCSEALLAVYEAVASENPDYPDLAPIDPAAH